MKYFTYNSENAVSNLKQCYFRKDENSIAQFVHSANLETAVPTIKSAEVIKNLLNKLKIDKENFKAYILFFDKLDTKYDIITNLNSYYNINWEELYKVVEEHHKNDYPIQKTIKTNLMYHSDKPLNSKGYSYSYAKAVVWTKPGVKLSSFKTYSGGEIDDLKRFGDIIVISSIPYGKPMLNPTSACHLETKTLSYEFNLINLYGTAFDKLQERFPYVIDELLKDIDLAQISKDYQTIYKPTYKQCLKYLAECAKISSTHKEEEKKNLYKQIDKINQSKRELQDISKQILDSSKGR